MRVRLRLYCRAPLGHVLDRFLKALGSYPPLAPRTLSLVSRCGRTDLSIEEMLRSASTGADDICELTTAKGDVGLHWLYGFRHHVPKVWATLNIRREELPAIRGVLGKLTGVVQTSYGICDTETVRQIPTRRSWPGLIFPSLRRPPMADEPHTYETEGVVSALHDFYWWNYFGPEYRAQLPLTDAVRAAAFELEELDDGGLVLLTRRSPKDPVDPECLAVLAREWPVFRKYDKKAGFKPPVRIDYSQVWNLPAPELPALRLPRETVGPPDEFIANVPSHARRFVAWAQSQGLAPPGDQNYLQVLQGGLKLLRKRKPWQPEGPEEDFFQVLREHEAVIRDELMVPAIAAYGELVRARIGGVWRKSILHRGEPVVVRPGRPWTSRRVILEVHDGMEPLEL